MTSAVKQRANNATAEDGAKSLGAFYTGEPVANFLTWWGVRTWHDTILDPSFGGGVFLRAASHRVNELGGRVQNQVFGVEVDPGEYERVATDLASSLSIGPKNLVLSDFFEVDHTKLLPVDVVIGNPPFIRYQRFSGDVRKRALRRALEQGVRLSELASSWAPFLIHSIAMLKEGGRLAMVIPVEIGHAAYARPVLEYLYKSFRDITFLTFQKKLFPQLSEDTLLLLAENKGDFSAEFRWRDFPHADFLVDVQRLNCLPLLATSRISSLELSQGRERLVEYFVPKAARELYRELKEHISVMRLGSLADVGIGYVTGANDFFHLSPDDVRLWNIPQSFLRPAVRRSRVLSGVRFTHDDWHGAIKDGDAGYLLYLETTDDLPDSVLRYLEHGDRQGVSKAYKCRTRSPWFRVPHVYRPDALLSYMSGISPRLVANDAQVVAPNTLHVVRLLPNTTMTGDGIATLWQTSLTRLSVEIEGHALGGGMLKLEPTEAENVLIACPDVQIARLLSLTEELDMLIRKGDVSSALDRADSVILREGIGLSRSDCDLLKLATDKLRDRRYSRGTGL
jgi:adenine-specific DNA methylase